MATNRSRSKRMSLVVSRFGFGKSLRCKDPSLASVSQEATGVEMKVEELESVAWEPSKKMRRTSLEHASNDMDTSTDTLKVDELSNGADVDLSRSLKPCRCSASGGSGDEAHFHCPHCAFTSPLVFFVVRHIIEEHKTASGREQGSRMTARKSTTVRLKKIRPSRETGAVDVSPSGGDSTEKKHEVSRTALLGKSENASRKPKGISNDERSVAGRGHVNGAGAENQNYTKDGVGLNERTRKETSSLSPTATDNLGGSLNGDIKPIHELKRDFRADRDKKMVNKVTIGLDGVERMEKVAPYSGPIILSKSGSSQKKFTCPVCKQKFVRIASCRNHLACSHDILFPGQWWFQCLPCRYTTSYQYLFASHKFSLLHLSVMESCRSDCPSPTCVPPDVKPDVNEKVPPSDADDSTKLTDRQRLTKVNRVKWFYGSIPNALTSRQVIGGVRFVQKDRSLVWNNAEHVCSAHCTGKGNANETVSCEQRSSNVKPVSVERRETRREDSGEKPRKEWHGERCDREERHEDRGEQHREECLGERREQRRVGCREERQNECHEEHRDRAERGKQRKEGCREERRDECHEEHRDRTGRFKQRREGCREEHREECHEELSDRAERDKQRKEGCREEREQRRDGCREEHREECHEELSDHEERGKQRGERCREKRRVATARKSTVQRPKGKSSIIDVDQSSPIVVVDIVGEGPIDVDANADNESTTIRILSVSGNHEVNESSSQIVNANKHPDVIVLDDDSCDADVAMLTSPSPVGHAASSVLGQQHASMTVLGLPIMSYLLQSLMNPEGLVNSQLRTPTPQSSAGERPPQRPPSHNETNVAAASSQQVQQPVSASPAAAMSVPVLVASPSLDQFSQDELWFELCRRGNLRSCPCGVSFNDVALYLLHRSCHASDAPLRCAFCPHNAPSSYDFHGHLLDHKK